MIFFILISRLIVSLKWRILRSVLLIYWYLLLLKATFTVCFISTWNSTVLNLQRRLRYNRLGLRFQANLRKVAGLKSLDRFLLNTWIRTRLFRPLNRHDRRHFADLLGKLAKKFLIWFSMTRRQLIFDNRRLNNRINDLLAHRRLPFFDREHLQLLGMLP